MVGQIANLDELEPLAAIASLASLDLYQCPVTQLEGYAKKVFGIMENLSFLDGLDSEGQEREFEGGDDDDDDEEDEEEEEGGSDEESVSVCDQRRSPLQKTPLPLPPASATRIRALMGGLSIFTANLLILPPEGVVELALTSTGTRALRAHYQSRTVCLRPLFPSSSCTGRETRLTVG